MTSNNGNTPAYLTRAQRERNITEAKGQGGAFAAAIDNISDHAARIKEEAVADLAKSQLHEIEARMPQDTSDLFKSMVQLGLQIQIRAGMTKGKPSQPKRIENSKAAQQLETYIQQGSDAVVSAEPAGMPEDAIELAKAGIRQKLGEGVASGRVALFDDEDVSKRGETLQALAAHLAHGEAAKVAARNVHHSRVHGMTGVFGSGSLQEDGNSGRHEPAGNGRG